MSIAFERARFVDRLVSYQKALMKLEESIATAKIYLKQTETANKIIAVSLSAIRQQISDDLIHLENANNFVELLEAELTVGSDLTQPERERLGYPEDSKSDAFVMSEHMRVVQATNAAQEILNTLNRPLPNRCCVIF